MSLIDAPQFNLASQVRQFGQFSPETNQVRPNDVLQCLAPANVEAAALHAETRTPAANQATQHAAYLAGTPQYKGVFTS